MGGPRAPSPLRDADGDEKMCPETEAGDDRTRFVEHLFERYRRPLLRYVSALLGRRADAEDILQEAYVRLLGVPALDATPARARAYLFKIATNLVRDRFRRADTGPVEAAHDDLVADGATPERIVDFEQGLDAIRRALLELKPRCREVFLLRTADGLDYDAIAARLGISKRTVEREMKHALDVCQQRLERAWK